jgi:hypothetical protein
VFVAGKVKKARLIFEAKVRAHPSGAHYGIGSILTLPTNIGMGLKNSGHQHSSLFCPDISDVEERKVRHWQFFNKTLFLHH